MAAIRQIHNRYKGLKFGFLKMNGELFASKWMSTVMLLLTAITRIYILLIGIHLPDLKLPWPFELTQFEGDS